MRKIFSIIIVSILIIGMSSCGMKFEHVTNAVEHYEYSHFVLKENEGLTVDVNEIFKNSNIVISSYEIECENPDLVKIKKNKITPLSSGISKLSITIFEKETKTKYITTFANIYTIIESDMIEISTKEQLIAMQNERSGNYILRNDINLKDVDWEPIGNMPANNRFSGMFVNLDGYKIKNLTVTSSENVYKGPYGGCCVGLFGATENSFFYGLELEKVNFNVSDFLPEYFGSNVGGIVGSSLSDTFYNCKVDGELYSTWTTGGIAGSSSWSRFVNCEFAGKAYAAARSKEQNGSGGICGYFGGGRIVDCKVYAELESSTQTGFIAGWCETFGALLKGNECDGEILSGKNQTEMFGKYVEKGSINNIN